MTLGARPHESDLDARRRRVDEWLGVPRDGYSSSPADGIVVPLATAASALRALKEQIDACTGPEDLIVLACWAFNKATFLDVGVTIEDSLRAASERGVPIRALFAHAAKLTVPRIGDGEWKISGGGADNTAAVRFIDSLPTGLAVHDAWVLHLNFLPGTRIQMGAQHQKIWAVSHDGVVTTFVGGVDISPTRSPFNQKPGDLPWHDVQLELHGTPAVDAYAVVQDRWNTHPDRPAATLPDFADADVLGDQRTRLLTTYGDPRAFDGLGGPPYPFAPHGSTTIRGFLSHAITKAERFIYLEDQYLVDASIGQELAARMPEIDGLVIVISPDKAVNGELFQAGRRRAELLAPLQPFGDKVAVMQSAQFVHAKLWIFDDEIALVGSANCNRRGYSHDSEASVAFGDLITPGAVQQLRARLWTRALGTLAPAALAAPFASVPVWKSATLASRAHVEPYTSGIDPEPVPQMAASLIDEDDFWDHIVDPCCIPEDDRQADQRS